MNLVGKPAPRNARICDVVTEALPTSHLMVLMFTDLVGSVELKMRLGNTAYIRLIARHDRILKDIVRSLPGASILKDTGDGFLVAYATASDGIRAGLRFQWAIFGVFRDLCGLQSGAG